MTNLASGLELPEGATTGRHPSIPHLLILGGTGEAAALARGALARFGDQMAVTTALAGRTRNPGPIAGQVRIGGFGGAAGLAAYVVEREVDWLIDATHPFAAAISRAARLAAAVARRAREVALATLSGATAVEVAIVDRSGDFLARVGAES